MLRDGRQWTGDEIEGELLELDGLSAADGSGVGVCVPGGSGDEPLLRGDRGTVRKVRLVRGQLEGADVARGRKKPNDLGVFDLNGNVWNWCQESYQGYPQTKDGEAIED